MPPITIHGNIVDPDATADGSPSSYKSRDAKTTNFIYIQGNYPLKNAEKIQLRDLGVQIQRYEGENTYLAQYLPEDLTPLRSLPFVRHANAYHKYFKTSAHLKDLLPENDRTHVIVQLHDGARSGDHVAEDLGAIPGVQVDTMDIHPSHIAVSVDAESIAQIEQIDDVRNIQLKPQTGIRNDRARVILGANQTNSCKFHQGRIWTGSGQVVTVADTGFDIGKTDLESKHPAFRSSNVRLVAIGRTGVAGEPLPSQLDDPIGHGTHVAASVLGSSTSTELGGSEASAKDPVTQSLVIQVDGTAPGADLVVQSLLDRDGGLSTSDIYRTLFSPAYGAPYHSRIHTNSWGETWSWPEEPNPQFGPYPYNDFSEAIDKFTYEHQDFNILFAAGNDNGKPSDSLGTKPTAQVGGAAAAKNCITVGASESSRKSNGNTYDSTRSIINDIRAVSRLSSIGPTKELRSKPDVVAPGTAILSARSRETGVKSNVSADPLWAFLGGTSMATPLVTGCIALIRQALLEVKWSGLSATLSPTSALIKALLIHYATPMAGSKPMATRDGSEIVTYGGPPDPRYGYGLVNVDAVLTAIAIHENLEAGLTYQGFEDSQVALKEDEKHQIIVTLPPRVNGMTDHPSLRVTMVYLDPPGEKIQNWLQLEVQKVDSGEKRNAWQHQAVPNNVQQVIWEAFPGRSAVIEINAQQITQIDGSSNFAVVWDFV